MPKKYKKLVEEMSKQALRAEKMFYTDSLVMAMHFRRIHKLQIPKHGPYFIGGQSLEWVFMKYMGELLEIFNGDYELGVSFAKWLLKQPLDYKVPVIAHAEFDRIRNIT